MYPVLSDIVTDTEDPPPSPFTLLSPPTFHLLLPFNLTSTMVFFRFLHYVFIPIITSMFRKIIRNYVFLFEQVLQVIRFFAIAEDSGSYQS